MGINYNNVEKMVYNLLSQYGTDMYFYHEIDGEKNSVTGTTDYSYLKTSVKGMAISYGDIFIDNDLIKKGDKQLIISMRQGRPKLGDRVKIDDTYFNVINVKELKPANKTLLYELHVRSYAVGENIDTLFISLGDLQTGSLIKDPNKEDSPIWRVVAHDHHKAGITTLICDYVWTNISFNGSLEKGYVTAETPWTNTFIRSYLKNTFPNDLSAKMIGNLQGCVVKTGNEQITDTVTILSKYEMGGTKRTGSNDGTFIPYFENSSSRIAYYDDPKRTTDVNTEYWTRDGNGIGADGNFTMFNYSYSHGLRPVIFLQSSLETALNYNGEYEVQFE